MIINRCGYISLAFLDQHSCQACFLPAKQLCLSFSYNSRMSSDKASTILIKPGFDDQFVLWICLLLVRPSQNIITRDKQFGYIMKVILSILVVGTIAVLSDAYPQVNL